MRAAGKGRELGKVRHGILALVAAASLAACGGGGGGGGVGALPPADGPGRPVTSGLSSGLFLGRGSVIVNGVQFTFDNTVAVGNSVFIDNVAQTTGELALEIGMVVKVRGTFGPRTLIGTYDRIDVEPQLIGTVASPTANSFSVLNQSVTVTPFTIFDGIARPPAAGTVVEVHGSFTGPNEIEATFVRGNTSSKVQVRGVVDSVLGTTLSIGLQQVDFSGVTPAPGVVAGDFVEVEGTLSGATILATLVDIEDIAAEAVAAAAPQVPEVEIEGSVVAAPLGNTFTLRSASGPVTVGFNATTVFEDEDNAPILPDDVLVAGNQVEVEGNIVSVGGQLQLQATEIELERKENVVLEGNVASVNVAARTFTVSPFEGTGVTFTLTADAGVPLPSVGQHVEVGGEVLPGSAAVTVTRVTPIPDLARAANLVFQGPVDNNSFIPVTDNTFSILGIRIVLTGLQERDDPALGLTSEFENAANIRIDRGNFMNRLRNDSVVKAKATEDASAPPFTPGSPPTFSPRAGVEIEEHR